MLTTEVVEAVNNVIFDMDGVLMDSEAVHHWAYEAAFSEHGYHIRIDYKALAGMSTEEAIEKVARHKHLTLDASIKERLVAKKRRLAREKLAQGIALISGAKEVVETLSKNKTLCLASSASRENVDTFLRLSGFGNCFSFVLSRDEVQRAKPDPEIYFNALKLLNCNASNVCVIEDSVAGISSAQAAGIPVIALVGTQSKESLELTKPTLIINSLSELLTHQSGDL